MSKIPRHNKFSDIPNLDKELDFLLDELEKRDGKIENVLPNVNTVPELSKILIKQTDGSYKMYMRIGNNFLIQKTDGTNIYWTIP